MRRKVSFCLGLGEIPPAAWAAHPAFLIPPQDSSESDPAPVLARVDRCFGFVWGKEKGEGGGGWLLAAVYACVACFESGTVHLV